ncbi:MAG: signal peptidase I [Gemmatimonadetes bacterium]|nr:MAG: signal peptidase I [Gemmatimonadota bacterium]
MRVIAFVVTLFVVIRVFVVEAFKIPTASMEGTLLVGDFLLVNKLAYGTTIPGLGLHVPGIREPARGDVVVFHPPHEPEKNYVKRLVGLPGDTLEMRDKVLIVNGVALDEPYVQHLDRSGADAIHPRMQWQQGHLIAGTRAERGRRRLRRASRDNWGPLVVPEGRYFMLGDNRDNSEDSRYFGFVSRDAIRGRPWFVYYSFEPSDSLPLSWLRSIRWSRLGHAIR